MENPSNIQPDQVIVVEGDAGFVPKAEPSDAGKVLGVVNASGDVGWVDASGGQLTQQQADWAETDPSKVTFIDNKPDLSVYATASAVDTALAGKQDTISDLSDIRAGASAGATAVQPSALDSYATTSAMNTALAGKQDTISDLSDIRAGAAKGDTAVQPAALNDYATTAAMNTALAGKQDVINDLADIRSGASAGATAVQPSALDSYATTSAMNTALAGKQDVINDLSDIRAGASAGATAVQPAALEDYATVSAMNTALAGKQNTISDLDTIRAGAAAGATAAQPSDLPSSDELLPSASSGDAGKILSVDASGNPEWITPSGGTTYTAGDGIGIDANNVISADVDGVTIGIDSTTKKIKSLQSIPTKTSDLQNDSGFITSSDIPAQVQSNWNESDVSAASFIQNKPQNLVQDASYVHTDENFTSAEKTKLSGIAAGAEVNVQPDWAETDSSSDAYIANKPTIPTVDQTYDASSTNAQSGVAVASAISGVNAVPASTSVDSGKVLTVDSQGAPVWSNTRGTFEIIEWSSATYSLVKAAYDAGKQPVILDKTTYSSQPLYGYLVTTEMDPFFPTRVNSFQFLSLKSIGAYFPSSQSATAVQYTVPNSGQKSSSETKVAATFTADSSVTLTQDGIGQIKISVANPLPASTSAEADKVLTVDSTGTPVWAAAQGGTVDQSYNASSTNAQSGTAVAQAIAAIPSSSYTAGDAIDITNNEISVDYDTDTLDVVGQTVTENVTQQSASGLFLLPSNVAALLSQQAATQVTVHIPANTLKDENLLIDAYNPTTYKLTLYATDSPSETSVSLFSTPVEYTGFDEDNAELTEQDIVFNLPASVANQWSQNLSSAVAFNICGGRNGTTYTSLTLTVIGDLSTSPITFAFVDASATKLAVKHPVPAATSADEDKVLTVDSNGTPVWAAAQGGGGTVDQTYNASSTNAQSGTAVAGALATVKQVPASTSSDEDKVLTVNSSGNPVWAEAAAPYSKPLVAGANITITDGANDVTIAATVPTVDQTYSAASTNAQSGVAVASAISGINAVPASTSADQDKVLTVNSSGTPVWAVAQGGGGSGSDSEFPYDPGYMHTGWNKMVVRFGDTSYDPTNKTSASSFTSIVALNEPGVYEYTFNLSSSHGSQLFQNEWNDITNNPVDILQLTSDDQLTGGYYNALFMGCTGLRSVWNIRGSFGSMLSWFRMCTNLEVVSGHIPERLAALNQDYPSFDSYGIKILYGSAYLFYKCIALKKAETLISFTYEASSNSVSSFFEDCIALKVGAPVLGYVSNATNAYKNCVKLVRLYGLSDLEGLYPTICQEYNPSYASYTTHTCNVDSMFLNCYMLSDLNGLELNYGKLINCYCIFTSCESIEKLPLLNIADNTNCSYAFNCCYALKEVPIMPYDKVVNAEGMFGGCRSITDVTGLTGLATICTNVRSLLEDCWWVVKGALDLYTALQASPYIATYSSAFTLTGVNGWNDQRSQIPSSWGGTGA